MVMHELVVNLCSNGGWKVDEKWGEKWEEEGQQQGEREGKEVVAVVVNIFFIASLNI